MYTIQKEFAFSAAHHLEGLPPEHQCSRPHGHNYVVIVVLEAEALDDTGFVQDYGELSPVKQLIDSALDHQDLNVVLAPMQTSAENIARWLYDHFKPQFPMLAAVKVSETPKTWAEYRRD